MRKSHVGNRFLQELRTLEGRLFYGSIYRPSIENERSRNLNHTTRILRADYNSGLSFGDVVISAAEEKYICASNGSANRGGFQYHTYRLFPVDAEWMWETPTTTLDPLTGLETGNTFVDTGIVLNVSVEPEPDRQKLDVKVPTFQVITNVAPALGDRLNGEYIVERVEPRVGVWSVEVS